jgi:hypothetical protein
MQAMRETLGRSAVLVLIAAAVACGEARSQSRPAGGQVNPQAAVLADFQKRVESYLEVRKKAEKGPAEQEESSNPAEIRAAQDTLAARIRAARADARPGDIFTPEIRAVFRRLMYPETKGAQGRRTKEIIEQDAPPTVPLKVNAEYPEGKPLPTVPPNILESLPQLPEALEYRIVDRHLILRDVDANLIIDYIPNAIRS